MVVCRVVFSSPAAAGSSAPTSALGLADRHPGLGDHRARQPQAPRLRAQPPAPARGRRRASSTATCARPATCSALDPSTRSSSAPPSRARSPASTASPDYLVHSNLFGAYHCLELARRDGAQFVFISTSRVYPVRGARRARAPARPRRASSSPASSRAGASERGIAEDFPLDGRAHALRRDQARRRAPHRPSTPRPSACRR